MKRIITATVMNKNMRLLWTTLDQLLAQERVHYIDATPKIFPEEKGIYVILGPDNSLLRAGKTGATLRQRLYNNHLMGTQPGNLPAQLVGSGECSSLAEAKSWIRQNCTVAFLAVPDDQFRSRVEHFMLAVVQPRFCDNNKRS